MPDLFKVSLKITGNIVYIFICLYTPLRSRQNKTLIDFCLKETLTCSIIEEHVALILSHLHTTASAVNFEQAVVSVYMFSGAVY